ncbi:uncharacterized mitochondrial protein AtMg00860-like [Rhodamnia argentea]|uniref:Uncharacterized mitochondrial protein AtMg00860-like n=1 Tax=Rhodamnia argentea TaxID=178133 RepID=A0ABM3HVU5_9MYRT|nr:uncharacterized mitochondrial protein AtMg00860-like [Rhodamnia argentea]
MNEVFQPFLRQFVVIFFDDILIYNKDLALHLDHLRQVFATLRYHHLAVKHSKCNFATPTIEFLGHIVSAHGVSADPTKLEVRRNRPIPITLKQVRGFLGLTGYYRHFIRHYATIAAHLTDLLTKDEFTWCAQAEHAYTSLKDALSHAPVLAPPDFAIPFIVETDANDVGIGARLMRSEHPKAFYIRKFSPPYAWDGMHKDIAKFVQACDICQKCTPMNHHPYELLHPLLHPTHYGPISLWTSSHIYHHLPDIRPY